MTIYSCCSPEINIADLGRNISYRLGFLNRESLQDISGLTIQFASLLGQVLMRRIHLILQIGVRDSCTDGVCVRIAVADYPYGLLYIFVHINLI